MNSSFSKASDHNIDLNHLEYQVKSRAKLKLDEIRQ